MDAAAPAGPGVRTDDGAKRVQSSRRSEPGARRHILNLTYYLRSLQDDRRKSIRVSSLRWRLHSESFFSFNPVRVRFFAPSVSGALGQPA